MAERTKQMRHIILCAFLGNISISRWWLEGGEGGKRAVKDLQWYLKRYFEEWEKYA